MNLKQQIEALTDMLQELDAEARGLLHRASILRGVRDRLQAIEQDQARAQAEALSE